MTLYQVAVYHNTAAQFLPYGPADQLLLVVAFARDLPEGTTAEQVADWTFRTFNIDLDVLENDHLTPGAETAFPLGCLYRLLRLRSLSTGDVIAVTGEGRTTWLACEPLGWRRVEPPPGLSARRLAAEAGARRPGQGPDRGA